MTTDAERWAAAAAWSRRTTLTPMETVLWRAERHPVQSSVSVLAMELDAAPEWERFVAAHEWGTRLVARLRQRVVDPALPTTAPVWAVDEDFDLDRHVRRTAAADRDEALTLAAELAVEPLDRDHPLWTGLLVEGLEGGRALWVLKIHHALADSLGAVELLSLLQSHTREHVPDKPVVPGPSVSDAPDPVDLATRGLLHDLTALPVRGAELARGAVTAALHPRAVTGAGVRYAASLRRLVSRQPAPPSPVLASRDRREWRFLALTCPLEGLRAAGAEAGGSLADVTVAAVLGGLQRYHAAHDSSPAALPVAVRVSLDRADDLGNRFATAMVSGPLGIDDPIDRIAAVRGEVLSLHTERALDAFAAFAPVANRLPAAVGAGVLASGAAADAFVLTLPGPSQAAYMTGARVEGLWSFGPLPGTALTATLVTYDGVGCLGVTVDAAAVDDIDVLRECLAEGLAEMASAGG